MENNTGGCWTGAVGYNKERTEDTLCEPVGLGIGHDEKDKGRDKAVLGLQKSVQHLTSSFDLF